MKKKAIIISSVCVIILLVGGVSFYFLNQKSDPPLVHGAVGKTNDKHAVLIVLGNKGTRDIKITNVFVNNQGHQGQTTLVKMQVSDPKKGFLIADNLNKKTKAKYKVKDVNSVTLQPHTSPKKQLKKYNNGNLNKNAVSYGISVVNDKPIHKVIIDYVYSGKSFEKTIQIKGMPIHGE